MKICKNCSKELIGKSKQRNIYCDNFCQGEFQAKEKSKKYLEGLLDETTTFDTLARIAKKYLISLNGRKCSKCDWNKKNEFTGQIPIELSHIDGNPENNKIENLELLCPNCHSLTEFHKSRGKGRKWRDK